MLVGVNPNINDGWSLLIFIDYSLQAYVESMCEHLSNFTKAKQYAYWFSLPGFKYEIHELKSR